MSEVWDNCLVLQRVRTSPVQRRRTEFSTPALTSVPKCGYQPDSGHAIRGIQPWRVAIWCTSQPHSELNYRSTPADELEIVSEGDMVSVTETIVDLRQSAGQFLVVERG